MRTKGVTIDCRLEGGNVPNIRVSEWVYMFCNGEQRLWAFLHHTSSSVSNTRVLTWASSCNWKIIFLICVWKYWKMTIIMFHSSRWCLQVSCFVWESAQNLFSLRSIIYDKHINLRFETCLEKWLNVIVVGYLCVETHWKHENYLWQCAKEAERQQQHEEKQWPRVWTMHKILYVIFIMPVIYITIAMYWNCHWQFVNGYQTGDMF